MAVTAAGSLSNFNGYLSRDEAAAIFQRAARTSVVQRLAREVPLGINGNKIPVFGRVNAGWTAEGAKKPTANLPFTYKELSPQKVAVLVPVSREVVRANPGGFMSQVQREMGEAIGRAFDYAALYDLGGDGTTAGGGPFTNYIAETDKTQELGTATAGAGGIRADFLAGMRLLADDGKKLTGFALSDLAEVDLLSAVDTTGRALWTEMDLTDVPEAEALGAVRRGRLLGRPAWMGEGVEGGDVVAVGGDWTQVAWGSIGGIEYAVSTEAAVTINGALVSAFENNLVIVRAEAEYGLVINDTNAFVTYTNAA